MVYKSALQKDQWRCIFLIVYHTYCWQIYTEISVKFTGKYLPPATKLGQGNIFTGVCDSVHSGGADPPWSRHPPHPEQSMLGDTVNARAVRILLECNLVDFDFAVSSTYA